MDGGERIQKGGAKKKGKIIKGPDDDTAYVEEGVRTRITGSGSTVFSIAWMHYYAWNPSPTIAVSNHRHAWTDLRSIIVAKGEKGFFSKNHSRYVCHFAPTFDAFYSPYTPLFLCIDACVCVSSPPPFPATFQSFLPCGEKKVGGGKAIAWGWQRGNYYLDGYDDDDGGGERNRVVVSCLCWSFLQGESNSSIRMAVYVRYSVE